MQSPGHTVREILHDNHMVIPYEAYYKTITWSYRTRHTTRQSLGNTVRGILQCSHLVIPYGGPTSAASVHLEVRTRCSLSFSLAIWVEALCLHARDEQSIYI